MRRSFRLIALVAAVSFSPLSGLHSTCEAAIDIKAPEPTDEPAPGSTVEFNIEVNIDDPPRRGRLRSNANRASGFG